MPIYEFKCKKCGQQLERLCKLGETGEQLGCPHCKNIGLLPLVSSFAAPGVKGGQDKCNGCQGGDCSTC